MRRQWQLFADASLQMLLVLRLDDKVDEKVKVQSQYLTSPAQKVERGGKVKVR